MTAGFRFDNLSDVNMTQPRNVMAYLNSTTNDLYGPLMLLGIFVLILIVQRRIDEDTLMVSGFGTAIISVFFFLFGFISNEVVVTCIILASVGFFIAVMGGKK